MKKQDDVEYKREKEAREAAENRRQLASLQLKLTNARKKGLSFMVTSLVKAIKAKEAAIKSYEETTKRMFSNPVKHSDQVENFIKHYNEEAYAYPMTVTKAIEVDKSKSISEMTFDELRMLINRLRDEREAEDVIRSLRRSAGLKETFENPAKIDTKTPIEQLYHEGINEEEIENFIEHEGTLGMHWGVRRYQRKDGTRTAAGKRRDKQIEQERMQYDKSEDYIKARESRVKGTASLSNEELKKLNERIQLENAYKQLTEIQMKKAESFVGGVLKDAGKQAAISFTKDVMLAGAHLLVREFSPTFAKTAFGMTLPVSIELPKVQTQAPKAQTQPQTQPQTQAQTQAPTPTLTKRQRKAAATAARNNK